MGVEEEIYRRLRATISEIALRHGRRNSPEFRIAAMEAIMEIVAEYPDEAPASDWYGHLLPSETDPEDGV
jgi:hypothetical protein